MVLRERIELSTSPLPRECSTTELPQLARPARRGRRARCRPMGRPRRCRGASCGALCATVAPGAQASSPEEIAADETPRISRAQSLPPGFAPPRPRPALVDRDAFRPPLRRFRAILRSGMIAPCPTDPNRPLPAPPLGTSAPSASPPSCAPTCAAARTRPAAARPKRELAATSRRRTIDFRADPTVRRP